MSKEEFKRNCKLLSSFADIFGKEFVNDMIYDEYDKIRINEPDLDLVTPPQLIKEIYRGQHE